MIVDDNVDHAASLEMLLEIRGFTTASAYDGPSGLRLILERRPRAAIVDIGLPGMSGLDIARAVRAELGDGIFLLAVTGWSARTDERASADAGFDRHIVKPAVPDDIAAMLGILPR